MPDGHWPQLADLDIRYRGSFAYVEGTTTEHDPLPFCQLRYLGSPDRWRFAIYLASKDGPPDSILPGGGFTGSPEESLDCAWELNLNDITAWTDELQHNRSDTRKNF